MPHASAKSMSMWDAAAHVSGIPPNVIYAIAMHESRLKYGDGVKRPYPWTININGNPPVPLRFSSREEASSKLQSLIRSGITNVDVGAMQVNYKYHGHSVARPEHLLDPKTNLMVAAVILSEHMRRNNGDQARAVADYHNRSPVIGGTYAARVYGMVDANKEIIKNARGSK